MPPVIHNREWISKSSIWFCHQELCTSHLQPPLSTLDFTTFFLPTLKDKWTIANSERKFLFVHLLNFSKFFVLFYLNQLRRTSKFQRRGWSMSVSSKLFESSDFESGSDFDGSFRIPTRGELSALFVSSPMLLRFFLHPKGYKIDIN